MYGFLYGWVQKSFGHPVFIICVIVYNLYYCCYAKTSSSAVQNVSDKYTETQSPPPSINSPCIHGYFNFNTMPGINFKDLLDGRFCNGKSNNHLTLYNSAPFRRNTS